jgi:hypothetical protein
VIRLQNRNKEVGTLILTRCPEACQNIKIPIDEFLDIYFREIVSIIIRAVTQAYFIIIKKLNYRKRGSSL